MFSTLPRVPWPTEAQHGVQSNLISEALACPGEDSEEAAGAPRKERRGPGALPASKGTRPMARMLSPSPSLLWNPLEGSKQDKTQGRTHRGWLPSGCPVEGLCSHTGTPAEQAPSRLQTHQGHLLTSKTKGQPGLPAGGRRVWNTI